METGKLTHSQSQPGGMDRTPPGTPKKGGKMLAIRVQMLDDTVTMFQVQAKALGRVLFDQVCSQLHLLESDYFGLEYQEVGGTKYWLDLEKPLSRQIGLSLVDTLVRFCVKFYTPDPSQLEEEFTRYLFCLQIKRDLSQGLLQCNNNTAALMASYIVQAECGDYVVEDYPDYRYLSSYKFVPNQDQELEKRIMENHKKHAGQSPAEADLNLLETARKCELYGIKMHAAKDHEGVPLNLAVAHMGIVVFQNFTKINTFSWAKIRKISFKRKRFLVKLHPEGYGYYKDTVEFFFEGRNECKNFWKKCVENHGFFRCTTVKKVPRQKTRVLSRGSSFRYSGRTQKQIVDFVRENYVKRQTFQRSQSFRHSSSAHSSVANVGTSISAHPLLPLGENAVVGTPASLSCGSMTLTSSPIHAADIHAGSLPSPAAITSVSPGTSVTSSPQHFYPQENLYPRAGHQRAKVTHSRDHSHHGISLPQGPINTAIPVSTHSVNHFNNSINDVAFENGDTKNGRRFSDANFNDVYSNCYDSLMNLHYGSNRSDFNHNKMKAIDVNTDFNGHFLNETSKSNESVGSLVKESKSSFKSKSQGEDDYDWHPNRSSSYKDLYLEENLAEENMKFLNNKENSIKYYDSLQHCKFDPESVIVPPQHKSFKTIGCSPMSSKISEVEDQKIGDMSDLKIYSNSYPGTANSLLTEPAEQEFQSSLVKYDSLGELVLSHDDVSHDSYELLEKDSSEFSDETQKKRGRKILRDSNRARSCSWGSDRGRSLLNFRSTENVLFMSDINSNEKGSWFFETERNLNHKSEGDFRSWDRKSSKKLKTSEKSGIHRSMAPMPKRNRYREPKADEVECSNNNESVYNALSKNKLGETEVLNSKKLTEKEYLKFFEKDWGAFSQQEIYDQDQIVNLERGRYRVSKKNLEKCQPLLIKIEPQDKFSKEKQYRLEERRRLERRQEKTEERFHEGLKDKDPWDWEKEKKMRLLERKKFEEKIQNDITTKEEKEKIASTKSAKNFSDFKEINPKKFDRVLSNQFGDYSEFLSHEKKYDLLLQEKKVMENYEKVCQVGKLAKEMEMRERNSQQEPEYKNTVIKNYQNETQIIKVEEGVHENEKFLTFKTSQPEVKKSSCDETDRNYALQFSMPVNGKTTVERTKSDPFSTKGNLRRNVLTHQKSIDLPSQQSFSQTASFKHANENSKLSKTSRSEDDIPYILHKIHMNETPKNYDLTDSKTVAKPPPFEKARVFSEENLSEEGKPLYEIINTKKVSSKDCEGLKNSSKVIIQESSIHNVFESKNVANLKREGQPLYAEPSIEKKPETFPSDAKLIFNSGLTKELKKTETYFRGKEIDSMLIKKPTKEVKNFHDICMDQSAEKEEPLYAEVYKGKIVEKKTIDTPPQPPERTTSMQKKFERDNSSEEIKTPKETIKNSMVQSFDSGPRNPATPPESFKVSTFSKGPVSPKAGRESLKPSHSSSSTGENSDEIVKAQAQPVFLRNATSGSRHKESLILFARTRLGQSEGSAFSPVRSKTSPTNQRRTKSLDAPYVSLNRLPPVNAFSSKDDTLDANENNVLPPLERLSETIKKDVKALVLNKTLDDSKFSVDENMNKTNDSRPETLIPRKSEIDSKMRKMSEVRSNVELFLSEERTLERIRSKRLLSKIESIDGVDSEGDSSKLTDAPSIPSDRLVNLPESVRFPSVRQISGQTSEESADGWEQIEVKVKRRTPRRSIGREEPEIKESVVWDSKDDELPDDEVWDDNLVFSGKFEGGLLTDIITPVEYLKRGSCGQSIDDDNLSTPMKESSPEHWISVDDLPEAIEREEKFLRKQEEILREKILNEKLKQELNLDAIEVDGNLYDYKISCMQIQEETTSLDFKGKIKSHSLDTYGFMEKKLREKDTNKHQSLDEYILREKPIKNYVTITDCLSDSSEKWNDFARQKDVEYVQCKVVNDFREIQFGGDNDEELEEFFVVLDEKSEKDGDAKSNFWNREDTFERSASKDESVISVPEEFRDDDDLLEAESSKTCELPTGTAKKEEHLLKNPEEDQTFLTLSKVADEIKCLYQIEGSTKIKISSQEGSRRNSVDMKKIPFIDDIGGLSPYEYNFRRNSNEPDRLSPLNDSRLGGNDSRRLSSEDSRKYSMSESVSEETRRRLSSTEETRRKRASLTKQCSVGADSLTDEMVSGVPECNSSFEHDDEKDVFEVEDSGVKSSETRNELKIMTNENGGYLENEISPKALISCAEENVGECKSIATPESEMALTFAAKEEVWGEPDMPKIHEEPIISAENIHQNLDKDESHLQGISLPLTPPSNQRHYPPAPYKNGYDSSQDSDIDKISEISLISHVQNQISRRNLSETGKCLRTDGIFIVEATNLSSIDGSGGRTSSEERGFASEARYSSEDMERTESSSFEGKPSPENEEKPIPGKFVLKGSRDSDKVKSNIRVKLKDRKTQEDKRDSGEDGSSSSSAPFHPKRELSSTWKPFLLESSGSSSLEENWLPPDDNAHLADEEETSNTSQQDESGQEELNYPTGVGYPVVNVSSAEMIVGGYSGAFALSRTLSRISERSTSEQERSDVEDELTKPSSHSLSAEEESMLSSDPGSLRGSAARIPDLPDDRSFVSETISEDKKTICEPFEGHIPPPLADEDWASLSGSGGLNSPLGINHHIETVYLEIYPEEARKVVVTEPYYNEENSSSDENRTLYDEGEFLHLSSDNVSLSTTTTTTQDGTVVPMIRKTARAGSFSEDASVISISERSSSTTPKSRASSTFGFVDDYSERSKAAVLKCGNATRARDFEMTQKYDSEASKMTIKMKPPKLKSPTGKIGFFETPTSKVRSPLSQTRFFKIEDSQSSFLLKSPTSRSESSSPKNHKRFFESPVHRISNYLEAYEDRGISTSRSDSYGSTQIMCSPSRRGVKVQPYYNMDDGAEKSFFGGYETGSLEKAKSTCFRKCRSYYSMTKNLRDEEDSSNSDDYRVPFSNTIPRASKKKRRHRVAMDLEIRDGKIVAPPKTRATVIENTDSDRSSPRQVFSPKENRRRYADI